MCFKSAPSNIALIKYMGKSEGNRPTNASLSLTLDHLRTFVQIEMSPDRSADHDHWEPLVVTPEGQKLWPIQLSGTGRQKFLQHAQRVKDIFGITCGFVIRSANNFPADCGIASSASSFAALTWAIAEACAELSGMPELMLLDLSKISRMGSGSSCRSFFKWALWRDEGAVEVSQLSHVRFNHDVILVDNGIKPVSSSQAHLRVAKSPLFHGRAQRAETRLSELLITLQAEPIRWRQAYEICWSEFWDMHSLFETCPEPFSYMTKESISALETLRGEVWKAGDGPIITMDAGANIHLLWRPEQIQLRQSTLKLLKKYQHLSGDLNA